jgi:hypothetical protein
VILKKEVDDVTSLDWSYALLKVEFKKLPQKMKNKKGRPILDSPAPLS